MKTAAGFGMQIAKKGADTTVFSNSFPIGETS
jgi:hypothetical protein